MLCTLRRVPCLRNNQQRGVKGSLCQPPCLLAEGVLVSAAMVSSEYKYVAWHNGIKKYIVQITCCGKRKYKAFAEESQAVEYLVKLTRKPEACLRREWYRKQQQVMHKWSPYKGIAWHRGNQRWVVQRSGKTLGTFVSHGQALAHLCHGLGVQKSALMKPSSFPKSMHWSVCGF